MKPINLIASILFATFFLVCGITAILTKKIEFACLTVIAGILSYLSYLDYKDEK